VDIFQFAEEAGGEGVDDEALERRVVDAIRRMQRGDAAGELGSAGRGENRRAAGQTELRQDAARAREVAETAADGVVEDHREKRRAPPRLASASNSER